MLKSMFERLKPLKIDSGFRMEGYYIWCGSVIKVDNKYHMFASRWPEKEGFPDGYRCHSEIVRAVSDDPCGPFTFCETVISGRKGNWWDAQMAHNPTIHKIGDKFVLFYTGSQSINPSTRAIGYAYANKIDGHWSRSDTSIELVEDCNNPAVFVKPDHSIILVFRYADLKIGIATSNTFDGHYKIQNHDIMPHIQLEDPYLYYNGKSYEIVLEDNAGKLTGHIRYGGSIISKNGIDNWTINPTSPVCYTHTLSYEDNSTILVERRERPQLIINQQGKATHLYTAVLYKGKTWNACQEIMEEINCDAKRL